MQTQKQIQKSKQNAKLTDTFYAHIRKVIANQYNVLLRSVGVFANSAQYPNTVTLTTEDMVKYDIAIFVQYLSSKPSTFVIEMRNLMPILDKWYKEGNTIMCDSRCIDMNEFGNLIRVPFDALEPYRQEII